MLIVAVDAIRVGVVIAVGISTVLVKVLECNATVIVGVIVEGSEVLVSVGVGC